VQGISTGTISNSATPGVGIASIGGTAANPVVNVNFPNDVQSVSTGTVTNSGTTGTLSIGGTATNPVVNVNFPASSGGVTSAQAVTAAQKATAYGSGSGGALVISTSEDWTGATLPADANGGFLQYASITVNSGVTWTIPSGFTFLVTGTVTIDGTILVKPTLVANIGFGMVIGNAATGSGYCVSALLCITSSTFDQITLASLLYPGPFGGGQGYIGANAVVAGYGATPGGGGGSLVIRAQGAITIGSTGQITANGGNATGLSAGTNYAAGSGGGGGGIVILASQASITNDGTLSAAGGNGANAYYPVLASGYGYSGGGGGGGGLIHLLAPGGITAGTIDLLGGTAGTNASNNPTGTYGGTGGSGGAMGGAGGVSSYDGMSTPTAGGAGQTFTSTLDPTALFTH
jgi:hypothetical protein